MCVVVVEEVVEYAGLAGGEVGKKVVEGWDSVFSFLPVSSFFISPSFSFFVFFLTSREMIGS